MGIMTSKEFVESKLVNFTQAMDCDVEVRDCRYYYRLVFDENIGWEWLEKQVEKSSAEVEPTLELYKIGPVEEAIGVMVVEVRELERREGIDDNQQGLDSFAESL